ncbi:MAG: DUF4976 domain-containing protein, partial [Planctomycetaceae bacterium]|nr:DUF4976 domain-containing protein [Planctomycetaceae bacterium]
NHALRDNQYRLIRYQDGSEELYDHKTDPMEWKNLADDPQYAEVKQRLAKSFPSKNALDAPHDPKRSGNQNKKKQGQGKKKKQSTKK